LYSASLKVKCQTPRNVIYCNTNSIQPWKSVRHMLLCLKSQTTKKSKSFRKNTLKQTQCEPSLWLSKVRRKTFPYYWPIKKKYVEWRHSKTNALFITEMPLLKCGKRSQGKIHVRKEKCSIIKAQIFRFCSFFSNRWGCG